MGGSLTKQPQQTTDVSQLEPYTGAKMGPLNHKQVVVTA